jgi:peptide/nickel transport system ATP-binding protein
MNQRVGVAMGMFFSPRILLADEPTSALDVTTQAQVVEEMMGICRDDGTAIIIVTHNLGVAAYKADEIIVMRNGHIEERGTSDEIVNNPKEDYTKELLDAVPQIGGLAHDIYEAG